MKNIELLIMALTQAGVEEIPGLRSNPEILKYFATIKQGEKFTDEDGWCAAFVNWVAKMCGCERTETGLARDFLNVGEKIDHPELGDVVIFWRGSKDGWQGHVGFFWSREGDLLKILGGNQKNMVCVSDYGSGNVLGYRRLRKLEKK